MSDIKEYIVLSYWNHLQNRTVAVKIPLGLAELIPHNHEPAGGFGLDWLDKWEAVTFTSVEDANTRGPMIEQYALGCLLSSNMANNTNYSVVSMGWDTNTGLVRKLAMYLNPPVGNSKPGSGGGAITPTPPNQPQPPLR